MRITKPKQIPVIANNTILMRSSAAQMEYSLATTLSEMNKISFMTAMSSPCLDQSAEVSHVSQ
jgi:hypothetical protein